MNTGTTGTPPRLQLRLLGEVEVRRDGRTLPLPPSKKTRALLAYLALSGRAHRRERLCTMLWDVADDPRAALRWSLSKLRPLVDDPQTSRLQANREQVRLELDGVEVDVLTLRRSLTGDFAALPTPDLQALAEQFRGELLEGLELTEFESFYAWCVAEREELRRQRQRLLETLVVRCEDEPEKALPHARILAAIDPLNSTARRRLLRLLLRSDRRDEAEQSYQAGMRLMRELGSEEAQRLEEAWRSLQADPPVDPSPVAAVSPPPPKAVPVADLYGREGEWSRLVHALEKVTGERQEQVVLLRGEPGVGKTRLLEELTTAARARGTLVLAGCAFEVERSRPYGPWIDALQQMPEVQVGDTLSAALAPLWRQPDGDYGGGSREQLFGAVVELLAALTHGSPVLLLIDDVQWCDQASVELLHYALRMNRYRPLLVALAARAGELADNVTLFRLLRQLRREPLLTEIPLGPLSRGSAIELVRALAPAVDVERVVADSAGNPLFLLELARAGAAGREDLPQTLSEAVRDRVDRLPPRAADVLRWAAVLGPTFRLSRLCGLVDAGDVELPAILEQLEPHALLRSIPDSHEPAYGFAHEIVRRVVYSDLSEPRRRRMHQRVAEQIEQLGLADEATIAELAHHASLAGQAGLAARACAAAGRRCLRVFANSEASAFARRGIHYAEQLGEAEQVPLLLDLLQISVTARRPSPLEPTVRRLQELAERALDHGQWEHARMGFHLVGHLRWEDGNWSEAQQQLRRAEVVSRNAGEREHVVAMAETARCLVLLQRDLAEAESLLLEAHARAQRLDFEPVAVVKGIGMLRLHQGELEEAASLLQRAQLLAERDGDHLTEFQALENRILLELQRCDYARAAQLCDELRRIAERLREGSEAPFAAVLSCVVAARCGDPQARGAIDATLAKLRAADAKQRLATILTQAAALDLAAGDYGRALERADEALAIARLLARPSEVVLAQVVAARAARALGDREKSEGHEESLRRELPRFASVQAQREAAALLGQPPAKGTRRPRKPQTAR